MQIADAQLQEFKRLYKQEFGDTLSDADAQQLASDVITLYMLLAEAPPDEEPSGSETD